MSSRVWPPCGCKPGDRKTGWREVRSQRCIEAELNQWRDAIERFKHSELYPNLTRKP